MAEGEGYHVKKLKSGRSVITERLYINIKQDLKKYIYNLMVQLIVKLEYALE